MKRKGKRKTDTTKAKNVESLKVEMIAFSDFLATKHLRVIYCW